MGLSFLEIFLELGIVCCFKLNTQDAKGVSRQKKYPSRIFPLRDFSGSEEVVKCAERAVNLSCSCGTLVTLAHLLNFLVSQLKIAKL